MVGILISIIGIIISIEGCITGIAVSIYLWSRNFKEIMIRRHISSIDFSKEGSFIEFSNCVIEAHEQHIDISDEFNHKRDDKFSYDHIRSALFNMIESQLTEMDKAAKDPK